MNRLFWLTKRGGEGISRYQGLQFVCYHMSDDAWTQQTRERIAHVNKRIDSILASLKWTRDDLKRWHEVRFSFTQGKGVVVQTIKE